MARPAPADVDPPDSVGDSTRSPRIDDEVTAPFAYDRQLAEDALLAFRAEQLSTLDARGRRFRLRWSPTTGLVALAVAGLAIAATVWVRTRTPVTTAAPAGVATGTATINSRPDGAQVVIDGVTRGITPLKLSLPTGQHLLELSSGDETRTIPLTIEAGTIVSHYIDLVLTIATPSTERLEISSDPPGAQVLVDGQSRGITPLTVAPISPGKHDVVISSADAKVKRTVNVAKGATASVVASLTPAGSSAGWLSITAPIELQILEGEKLMGTTSANQIMLPAGRHDLELSSQAFAFRTTVSVQVTPGKTTTRAVAMPNGSISINAVPWADVWLDGKSLGPTPLANVAVPIGNHEVVWRHPQFGERRQNVAVTTRTPVRVGVELNK